MSVDAKEVELPKDSIAVTATAPVNIAVIKYWGKRDTVLILPTNSSLSGTIDKGTMQSHTTIIASKSFTENTMELNGKSVALDTDKRLQAVVTALRARAQDYVIDGKVVIPKADWPQYKLRVLSYNNFPTAAGLASSASGLACFTQCCAGVFAVEGELTEVSRQGSGSSCRSLHGGFVRWTVGVKDDGSDSLGSQVVPVEHWPEMRVLILVANNAQKETPSTAGMQQTLETSDLLKQRIPLVEGYMKRMESYIQNKDFENFAKLTMQDSNQFHACCLDTYPPIFYLNSTSQRIIHTVHTLNRVMGRCVAAYTFDAGPNAVLYLLEKDMQQVLDMFLHFCAVKPAADAATDSAASFVHDPLGLSKQGASTAEAAATAAAAWKPEGQYAEVIAAVHPWDPATHSVKQVIVSKLGEGASVVSRASSF